MKLKLKTNALWAEMEYQMKHTQEKWSINEWTQVAGQITIGAIGTPLIATVHVRDVSVNEHLANAKLIAAAPLLLEACETALKHATGSTIDARAVRLQCAAAIAATE